jgi:hypothetical protein
MKRTLDDPTAPKPPKSIPAPPDSVRGLARGSSDKLEFRLDLGGGKPARLVQIRYPTQLPDAELHARMAKDAVQIYCSTCSNFESGQRVWRCHGADVAKFLNDNFDAKISARGLVGITDDAEFCQLCDAPSSVHISRSLARGTSTQKRGVKTVIHASRYGNPFVITKDGFTLGESMALFHFYVHDFHFQKLPMEFIKAVCKHAFVLSDNPVDLAREMEENTDETIRARYAELRAAVATERAATGLDAWDPM